MGPDALGRRAAKAKDPLDARRIYGIYGSYWRSVLLDLGHPAAAPPLLDQCQQRHPNHSITPPSAPPNKAITLAGEPSNDGGNKSQRWPSMRYLVTSAILTDPM